MSHGPTRYPSKGVCIYCGKGKVLLTDEHVVPYFIGGKHVIEKASCLMCADITKKFEQDVARDLWGDARAAYQAPTRRKKERATSITLADPKRVGPDLVVPMSEYPPVMIFYTMEAAGILIGADRTLDRSREWGLVTITDPEKIKAFEAKHPGRLTAKFKNVPKSFGRLIAKIAYCNAMTALDPSDFDPICLAYILGKKTNVSHVVGSSKITDPMMPGHGYFMRTVELMTSDRMLLIGEVRLLANNGTPTYHVVVGEVSGATNITRVNEKFRAISRSESVEQADPIEVQASDPSYPWLPKVWPVQ